MLSQSFLLIFPLLPLISSWTFTAGYRECSSGCCHYSNFSSTSLDYHCSSSFCRPASNSSCSRDNSYVSGYRECSNSVNCCYYSTLLTNLDYDCQGNYCTNATSSSYCNNTYTSGYRSCIYGCCKYEASLATPDYKCISTDCHSTSSSYCTKNTTTNSATDSKTTPIYFSGYRTCTNGCCYYYQIGYTEDFACLTTYCSTASSSSCSNGRGSGSSSDQAARDADILKRYSGKTYIVVVYATWKAFVVAGSVIAGIWFFLDIYLIYLKCFHKPRGWRATGGAATTMPNQQQHAAYQPIATNQQPTAFFLELGGVPDSRT